MDTACMSYKGSEHGGAYRLRGPLRLLACAIAVLPLAACPTRHHVDAEAEALAQVPVPLAWTVNRVLATHHLDTSSMESRDALPGHRFVVLDVSVRNRDRQPQVLSEGKLIAMGESDLQTF